MDFSRKESHVPRVSLLVPIYNGARYLEATIRSLLDQSFSDFELIVVDDASTDHSLEVIESFQDERIRILRHATNQGVSVARNALLDAARGRFWALSAQDDVSLPDRIEQQLAHLEAHSEIHFIGTAVEFIDGADQFLSKVKMPQTAAAMRWHSLFESPSRHSSLMVRADWARENGIRYEPQRRMNSDFYFILELVKAGNGYNLPEALVKYRLHGHNASRVRRQEYLDTGALLALGSIQRLLPELAVTLEQITIFRKSVLGMRMATSPLSLAEIKIGMAIYCDLKDAFIEKYPDAEADTVCNPQSFSGGSLMANDLRQTI